MAGLYEGDHGQGDGPFAPLRRWPQLLLGFREATGGRPTTENDNENDRMTDTSTKSSSTPVRRFFERQIFHLLALGILVTALVTAARWPAVTEGELWGWSTSTWLVVAIGSAIAHQVYVWLVWRGELYFRVVTGLLGERGFRAFQVPFAVLGLGRFSIVPLAVANRGQWTLPGVLQWGLAAVCVLLAGYLFYSVLRYFGFDRASGLDHFDPRARDMPLVDEGIFRYTSNGMYIFGFLIAWVPGLILESPAALLAAAFHHLYIWVHYFCTEKPDMKFIYGSSPGPDDAK